jgi:hypothetical protein
VPLEVEHTFDYKSIRFTERKKKRKSGTKENNFNKFYHTDYSRRSYILYIFIFMKGLKNKKRRMERIADFNTLT